MVLRSRKLLLIAADAAFVNLAFYIALLVRFDAAVPQRYIDCFIHNALIITVIHIGTFCLFGLYQSLWEYASIGEMIEIALSAAVAGGLSFVAGLAIRDRLPTTVYFMGCILTCLLAGGSRLSCRYLHGTKQPGDRGVKKPGKVMVVGAGSAGSMIIKDLKNNKGRNLVPVVVVDDDKEKHGTRINGVPVKAGRSRIKELAKQYEIDEIIVAMPSAPRKDMAEILRLCKATSCRMKTLPGLMDLDDGKVSVRNLRDVNIEDLLGREEIILNMEEISGYLKDETVLVTGGGGSIGSELCRQIARFGPKKLIIFDIYENNAYDLQNELLFTYKGNLDVEVLIGSCRDRLRLKEVFEKYRPRVVFHAAAHKHVPLMEGSPAEAVKNNVFGTLNTARRADDFGAKKFILISTDKAVNPTNIMGASKRLAEIIVQSMNRISRTRFAAVRFGNVLGSNGSVVPLFQRQIMQGGPVTVTHPEVTRYFMTISEAAQLVIQAGAMANGGEVFVLDMGEPVKIVDLARDLIRLSGMEPDADIRIEFTGLRPGEKLYEELLLAEEGLEKTAHKKIFIGKQADMSFKEVVMCIKALENSMENDEMLRECMAKLVPTYKYKREHRKMSRKDKVATGGVSSSEGLAAASDD
ncbi:MAG: polysaccharide biosynthesis protein [Acetivibrionales bacterium]|jgi:FlaA1/EpsC-like NDP-sugar epimerase